MGRSTGTCRARTVRARGEQCQKTGKSHKNVEKNEQVNNEVNNEVNADEREKNRA